MWLRLRARLPPAQQEIPGSPAGPSSVAASPGLGQGWALACSPQALQKHQAHGVPLLPPHLCQQGAKQSWGTHSEVSTAPLVTFVSRRVTGKVLSVRNRDAHTDFMHMNPRSGRTKPWGEPQR